MAPITEILVRWALWFVGVLVLLGISLWTNILPDGDMGAVVALSIVVLWFLVLFANLLKELRS